jgi:hypothetical protein
MRGTKTDKVQCIELAPVLETGGDIIENGRMKRGLSRKKIMLFLPIAWRRYSQTQF